MGSKSSSNKKEKFKITYNNGDRFEGEMLNGIREGYGSYFYHVGDKYVGYWHNNKKHGTGALIYKEGNLYVGLWRCGEKDGMGSIYLKTGEKYVGEFKNGKKHGRGYLYSYDGTKYVGFFHENKKHGRGLIYSKNDKMCRELWDSGILIENEKIDKKETSDNNHPIMSTMKGKSEISENLINDNSFENYIDEQIKTYSNSIKSKKQPKNFTMDIAKYFKARIPNNYFDTMQIITSASDLIFDKPDVIEWTNQDVISWLNHLGLEKYEEVFSEEKINGIGFIKCNVLEFTTKFKIEDMKDLKILLKSVDFLRIFVKIKKDYENYLDLEKLNEKNETLIIANRDRQKSQHIHNKASDHQISFRENEHEEDIKETSTTNKSKKQTDNQSEKKRKRSLKRYNRRELIHQR